MAADTRIYVAGHRGMVGSSIVRALKAKGNEHIVTKTRDELDLTDQAAVRAFFKAEKPHQVYLAAAKVGGIHANSTYPADFLYQNIMIASNVIDAAFHSGVKKLMFIASSCMYPRLAEQPMREEAIMTGPLEPTNEPYAVAKISALKYCCALNRQYGETHGVDYRCVTPSNLYGPGDNYNPETSHVIASLIRRFHEAKLHNSPTVTIWGSGKAMREFLYVDDMASAGIFVMNINKDVYTQQAPTDIGHVNIGYGSDVSISELAQTISDVVGYEGELIYDRSKPDGAPRKLVDSTRINNLGWAPLISMRHGLELAYQDFLDRHHTQ